jgi:NAD(P)-dependent dehydrogenase (short-subunit alcohol dehydrogenase family)
VTRALIHGVDDGLEAALRERGLEIAREGQADALITLGPKPSLQALAKLDPDAWHARFRAWTAEPFWAFQAWLQDLLRRGERGSWIAVTSTLGAQPFPGGGADGTAAVAIHTLVKVAAIEYGSQGVRANAIASGWRDSTIPAELDRKLALADTPTGRFTTDRDLAATVVWLLSDDAAQVNGEVLRIDGGYTITGGSRRDPRKE